MSNIEWTQKTWNPLTGCTKISAGCKFCYAEVMAKRLKSMGQEQYRDGFKLRLAPQMLDVPRKWKKPTTVFVNSMSDLFHEAVPLDYIKQVFAVMNETPRHTYQVLTKRADRLAELAPLLNWTPNIWMGVSVENQLVAHRVDDLRKVPAAVRFLSLEPLIGPVSLDYTGIDWVIVGGESGHGARPMHEWWVDDILVQAIHAVVPVFFKQWGKKSNNPNPDDPTMIKGHPDYAKGGSWLSSLGTLREWPQPQVR